MSMSAPERGQLVSGGFLRNVIRERVYWRRRQHQRIAGLADVVAPLTYAVGSTDSAALLRNYKNHPVHSICQQHDLVVGFLLRLGITTHERCVGAVVGMRVTLRVVGPSLTRQPGLHPFAQIARAMGVVESSRCSRRTRCRQAHAGVGRRLTTGSNAQSTGG